ncbi:MAG: low-specificity L-threonine aldolase [Candidatus Eisenbacteria sp.]|nr:low-specificity L-threonine aldolase [Candidatus Eisenbacteria bacterium]
MRKAIAEAEVGDDVHGDDPTVNRLEERMAELTGKEAALFVPSGTMGNEIAVRVHIQPGDCVIVDQMAHIYRFECGSAAILSGAFMQPLPGDGGILKAEEVAEAIQEETLHAPGTRLVCLENTHNWGGGCICPLDGMQEIRGICSERGIAVHLDGARLFNASVEAGIDIRTYSETADSVMICLSKGLGAPVGSVLMGTHSFIRRARRFRKILGGGMRQAGILAAAGLYAMDHNIARLREDHENARRLAAALDNLDGLSVNLSRTQTNIVAVDVSPPAHSAAEIQDSLAERGILFLPMGRTKLRLVTNLDVSREDIDVAIAAFQDFWAME